MRIFPLFSVFHHPLYKMARRYSAITNPELHKFITFCKNFTIKRNKLQRFYRSVYFFFHFNFISRGITADEVCSFPLWALRIKIPGRSVITHTVCRDAFKKQLNSYTDCYLRKPGNRKGDLIFWGLVLPSWQKRELILSLKIGLPIKTSELSDCTSVPLTE